ncbi:MAG: hypothetical protein GWN58_33375 [Anaerolineae bacterium]|nr:hypothetical protein [Thermoplasmata archaeon]NIV34168.1 hypothetical protein [Anaerolineae bacterium]NIY06019.1 hypothetical protein [Thermoplasmata archaeon]
MKISDMVREGTTEVRAEHRDPIKVADALLKGEKAIYKMRGERGAFVDASTWLGDMLRDATGLSGSFYKDKQLTELRDMLSKADQMLMRCTSFMNAQAKRIKKEHAENEKKKKERGY